MAPVKEASAHNSCAIIKFLQAGTGRWRGGAITTPGHAAHSTGVRAKTAFPPQKSGSYCDARVENSCKQNERCASSLRARRSIPSSRRRWVARASVTCWSMQARPVPQSSEFGDQVKAKNWHTSGHVHARVRVLSAGRGGTARAQSEVGTWLPQETDHAGPCLLNNLLTTATHN